MKTLVHLTIDTEVSMGGAWKHAERRPVPVDRRIFCDIGGAGFGIPLMASALNRHGMRATFFCETLAASVLGRDEIKRVTDFLLEAGQDVQLHAHPTYRYYANAVCGQTPPGTRLTGRRTDRFSDHDSAQQLELLAEAADVLQSLTGKRPAAFRAGGYAADRRTLGVLNALGIGIDSSFNPVYRASNRSFGEDAPGTNRVERIAGVWEIPVTVAATRLGDGAEGLKPFEICAVSNAEMETILNAAHDTGMRHVVAVCHSFETVKERDETYREYRPNRIVIRRLHELLRFLSYNADRFEVVSFGDLRTADLCESSAAIVPELGVWQVVTRKVVQGLNSLYWV